MPGGMWWEMWPHSRRGPVSDGLRLVLQATVIGCERGEGSHTNTADDERWHTDADSGFGD